eukprot:RCo003936
MTRTKDKHLRQERDRGQGWDTSLFPRDPNSLTVDELKQELRKRGLSTEGRPRHLRSRFVRALCVGLRPVKKARIEVSDESGRTVVFVTPDTPEAEACLVIEEKGKTLRYHDADRPTWTTVRAAFPVPPDVVLEWSVLLEQMTSVVVGVCRADAPVHAMLGCNDLGWGYFTVLASKHFNDSKGNGEPYGKVCRAGDRVTVVMDTQRGRLSFRYNGTPLGEAFHDIYGTVYPAVCLCGVNLVHCGKECVRDQPEPELASSSTAASPAMEVHLKSSKTELAAGAPMEGAVLELSTAATGGSLQLTPMALGLSFTPPFVCVAAGETVSPCFRVECHAKAPAGVLPVTVFLKPLQGNTNTL